MNPNLAGLVAEALALWRRERDLLLRIAAVFFFLPAFALRLFLVRPAVPEGSGDAANQAAMEAAVQWIGDNSLWLGGQLLIQLIGSAALLMLLLGAQGASVGQVLVRALLLLPSLIVATLATGVLTFAGLLLLILPGLYAAGRTFLVLPVLVAEPQRGPLGALVEGVRRSENRGWMLFLAGALPLLAATFADTLLGTVATAVAAEKSAGLNAVSEGLACAIAAAGAVGHALMQAAAYRLTLPRQGM